ncbi:MAG TPA: low molecular weight protein-tyrosine-phosphatase [Oleiagrimonas sp.]|nr:low molecular weight protein-tyrosine-phosphatase [Oleiagrimonas sp.]
MASTAPVQRVRVGLASPTGVHACHHYLESLTGSHSTASIGRSWGACLCGGGGSRDRRKVREVRFAVFQRVLIVCVGNICRSPTAEILFRHRLPNLDVASAGIGALVGRPMDATARAVLEEHHLDGSQHVARQLDDGMIRDADLILAMERTHIDTIVRRAPHVMGRTVLLGKWLEQREITDPYQQQRPAFEHVYRLIDAAVHAWTPYLQSRG